IAVVPLGAAARERALTLVAALRRTEDAPPVAIDYREAKVALHLKRADAVGARAALILGDEELARGEIVLRDLRAREQRALALPADPALAACEIVRAYRALAA
ncbi:MAG: His/Gly/Thr/Pro-type tRNA ligase C-terminal domain-containing protein, partial [Vulcanimicrobiaceae bacterium]